MHTLLLLFPSQQNLYDRSVKLIYLLLLLVTEISMPLSTSSALRRSALIACVLASSVSCQQVDINYSVPPSMCKMDRKNTVNSTTTIFNCQVQVNYITIDVPIIVQHDTYVTSIAMDNGYLQNIQTTCPSVASADSAAMIDCYGTTHDYAKCVFAAWTGGGGGTAITTSDGIPCTAYLDPEGLPAMPKECYAVVDAALLSTLCASDPGNAMCPSSAPPTCADDPAYCSGPAPTPCTKFIGITPYSHFVEAQSDHFTIDTATTPLTTTSTPYAACLAAATGSSPDQYFAVQYGGNNMYTCITISSMTACESCEEAINGKNSIIAIDNYVYGYGKY